MDAVEYLYLRIADRYTGIRRIEVCANRVALESYVQYSLFDDPKQTDKNYGKRNYPWRMYVIVYVAVLVLYFVMNGLLTSKLKKVNLAEVLKNRE